VVLKHLIRSRRESEGSTECSTFESESRLSYPGMLFVYPEKLDEVRLKRALACVLEDFPQYAGTFVRKGVRLRIQHAAGTVSFQSERTRASIKSWMAAVGAGRARAIEPQVSTLNVLRGREAALVVKFTEARDGCALGLSWSHAVGDMHSTALLMRAWANAYAGKPYEKPLSVPDRDRYLRAAMPNPSAARSSFRVGSWYEAVAFRWGLLRPATRVYMQYSTQELSTLQRALSTLRHVTINDALCAHVYTVLRRLAGATDPTNLCLTVNYRKRIGLSAGLIGNMTSLLAVAVDEVDTPAQLAAALRGGLDEYAARHANYHATLRVFEVNDRMTERVRLVSRQFTPGSGDIMITNWNNFGWYDLVFGECRPSLFHPIVLGATGLAQWVMIVYELPRSQGLGITLGLPAPIARRCLSPQGQALLHQLPQCQVNGRAHEETVHGHEPALLDRG
jgi:hypothetical protein